MNHLQAEGADQHMISEYVEKVQKSPNMPISERRQLATRLTENPLFFSWDIPRTREGFYHYKAGLPAATKRAIAFAPFADLLWLETAVPNVDVAANFAKDIRSVYTGKKLVYNLSPSFNWVNQGFNEASLRSFIPDLARHGYYCPALFPFSIFILPS